MKNTSTAMLPAMRTLNRLGKEYGYINEPYILRPIFKNFLDKYYPSKMNIDRARNLVDVFIILCNESNIYNSWFFDKEKGDDSFFVERYRLQTEYCIGRKTFENSIKLLKEMCLINYENRWDKKRQIRRRWFKLNDKGISTLIERASKMRKILDKDKENRVIQDNDW